VAHYNCTSTRFEKEEKKKEEKKKRKPEQGRARK
jgi:hypothetical protein